MPSSIVDGEYFISEIRGYLNDNPAMSFPDRQSANKTMGIPAHPFRQGRTKGGRVASGDSLRRAGSKTRTSETVEKTYKLCQEGFRIGHIAKQRNLTPATIGAHLEQLILSGYDIDIDQFVDRLKRQKIEELFLKLRQWNLNPVIEHFSGTVSYEEARLVRAFLTRKTSE